MSSVDSALAWITRFRGQLPAEGLGARGLERVARNPQCTRLQALTLASVSPRTAASTILGEALPEATSPFALTRGNAFEAWLIANGAAELGRLYREAGRPWGTGAVVNLTDEIPTSRVDFRARRQQRTLDYLAMRRRGDARAPAVLIKPRLVVTVLGQPHEVEPDVLVACGDEPFYRIVEIKSYAARKGKTAPEDTRNACRQAAVGVLALRQALGGKTEQQATADLVFSVPGIAWRAELQAMTIDGELGSLERFVDEAPAALAELARQLPEGATLDAPGVLTAIGCHYRSSCRDHCALAAACRREVRAAAALESLGDGARERLEAAGNLVRVTDLIRERAAARTREEAQLVAELQHVWGLWKEAVNDG